MGLLRRGQKRAILRVAGFVSLATLCLVRAHSSPSWHFTESSRSLVTDSGLRQQIFQALDAAQKGGTDPHISHFDVRAATAFEKDGQEHVVLGGNTEYE